MTARRSRPSLIWWPRVILNTFIGLPRSHQCSQDYYAREWGVAGYDR